MLKVNNKDTRTTPGEIYTRKFIIPYIHTNKSGVTLLHLLTNRSTQELCKILQFYPNISLISMLCFRYETLTRISLPDIHFREGPLFKILWTLFQLPQSI